MTALKMMQNAEAVKRLKLIGEKPENIEAFLDGNVRMIEHNVSREWFEPGAFEAGLRNFEKRLDVVVYLILRTEIDGDLIDTFFVVSPYPQEWQEEVATGSLMVFVMNWMGTKDECGFSYCPLWESGFPVKI